MVEYDPDCYAATSLLNLAADMSSLQERSQSPDSDFELELPPHIVPRCSVLRPKPIISKVASHKGRMRSSFRKQPKRRHFKEKKYIGKKYIGRPLLPPPILPKLKLWETVQLPAK